MENGREWLFSDKIAFTVMALLNANFSAKKSYNITVKYKNVTWRLMTFKKQLKTSKRFRLSV